MLRIAFSTALLLLGGLLTTAQGAERMIGHACVLSGNLLELPCGSAIRVRMFGIDAPEPNQVCQTPGGMDYPCGEIAASVLRDMIGEVHPVCEIRGRDFYDRPVAVCLAGKVNLNAAMVRRGWAVTFRRVGTYADLEAAARKAKRGLWAGTFDEPRKWRHATTGSEE